MRTDEEMKPKITIKAETAAGSTSTVVMTEVENLDALNFEVLDAGVSSRVNRMEKLSENGVSVDLEVKTVVNEGAVNAVTASSFGNINSPLKEKVGSGNFIIQETFNAHVPNELLDSILEYQKYLLTVHSSIDSTTVVKQSAIESINIRFFNIEVGDYDLPIDLKKCSRDSLASLINENLPLSKSDEKLITSNEPGQIHWNFSGINQFKHITIHIKNRVWSVEFARLIEPKKFTLFTLPTVMPQVHQKIIEKCEEVLQPVGKGESGKVILFQGPSGLGKSHCAQYYFYHKARHHHQMIAWISGFSIEEFKKDWNKLANQFRYIESMGDVLSDDGIIKNWCEEKLGRWLFIIDDVNIDPAWLSERLPKKGGHVLITTCQPEFSLSSEEINLSFSSLSSEDSVCLLKEYSGFDAHTTGYDASEQKAIDYFVSALGGSAMALTQIGTLIRKKGINFSRAAAQFQSAATQVMMLTDTVYDQLGHQTFIENIKKGYEQFISYLVSYYPEGGRELFEKIFKLFMSFLQDEITEIGLLNDAQYLFSDVSIKQYWEAAEWGARSMLVDGDQHKLSILPPLLNYFPVVFDSKSQSWCFSTATFSALMHIANGEKKIPFEKSLKSEEIIIEAQQQKNTGMPTLLPGMNLNFQSQSAELGHVNISVGNTGSFESLSSWKVPTRNPYFRPRPALMNILVNKLSISTAEEQGMQLVLTAATGMGGIGKTELARHYVTDPQFSKRYTQCLWLVATTKSQLRAEFLELAQHFQLFKADESKPDDEALITALHRWLSGHPGWLMVLDNVDRYSEISDWIPKKGGSVLVTSRDPSPGNLKDDQIIRVPILDEEEAILWLYQLSGRSQHRASQVEQEAIKELVNRLGRLPLAIAQAGAYLREQPEVTINEYLAKYIDLLQDSVLLKGEPLDADTQNRLIVTRTWRISLDAIERSLENKGLPCLVTGIVQICAFLSTKSIPVELIKALLGVFFKKHGLEQSYCDYLLDDQIGHLLSYSLIERDSNSNLLSIHRLVQEVFRYQMTLDERKNIISQLSTCYLNKGVVEADVKVPFYKQEILKNLSQHVRNIVEVVRENKYATPDTLLLCIFLYSIESTYGIPDMSFFEGLLKLTQFIEDPLIRDRYLALLHETIGLDLICDRPEQSLMHIDAAVTIRNQLYADEPHWENISSRTLLGMWYFLRDDFEQARAHLQSSFEWLSRLEENDRNVDINYQITISALFACSKKLNDQKLYEATGSLALKITMETPLILGRLMSTLQGSQDSGKTVSLPMLSDKAYRILFMHRHFKLSRLNAVATRVYENEKNDSLKIDTNNVELKDVVGSAKGLMGHAGNLIDFLGGQYSGNPMMDALTSPLKQLFSSLTGMINGLPDPSNPDGASDSSGSEDLEGFNDHLPKVIGDLSSFYSSLPDFADIMEKNEKNLNPHIQEDDKTQAVKNLRNSIFGLLKNSSADLQELEDGLSQSSNINSTEIKRILKKQEDRETLGKMLDEIIENILKYKDKIKFCADELSKHSILDSEKSEKNKSIKDLFDSMTHDFSAIKQQHLNGFYLLSLLRMEYQQSNQEIKKARSVKYCLSLFSIDLIILPFKAMHESFCSSEISHEDQEMLLKHADFIPLLDSLTKNLCKFRLNLEIFEHIILSPSLPSLDDLEVFSEEAQNRIDRFVEYYQWKDMVANKLRDALDSITSLTTEVTISLTEMASLDPLNDSEGHMVRLINMLNAISEPFEQNKNEYRSEGLADLILFDILKKKFREQNLIMKGQMENELKASSSACGQLVVQFKTMRNALYQSYMEESEALAYEEAEQHFSESEVNLSLHKDLLLIVDSIVDKLAKLRRNITLLIPIFFSDKWFTLEELDEMCRIAEVELDENYKPIESDHKELAQDDVKPEFKYSVKSGSHKASEKSESVGKSPSRSSCSLFYDNVPSSEVQNAYTEAAELLSYIGVNTQIELPGGAYAAYEEVEHSISDFDNHYSGDWINLLMHHYIPKHDSIKVYPSISVSALDAEFFLKITHQNEQYAFIPLNVVYGGKVLQRENHWVALIVDKENQFIFFLDPAEDLSQEKEIPLILVKGLQNFNIIRNPIDFQKSEKKNDWVKHCGAYAIEIFKCIFERICSGNDIVRDSQSDTTSVLIKSILSAIPCGQADNIFRIRLDHIIKVKLEFILEVSLGDFGV